MNTFLGQASATQRVTGSGWQKQPSSGLPAIRENPNKQPRPRKQYYQAVVNWEMVGLGQAYATCNPLK
jgi:hypothetical protein